MWSSEKNRDPPSPNFTLISGDSQHWKSNWPKNVRFFTLINSKNHYEVHTPNFATHLPHNFTQSVKFFPFFGGVPYILKIGFVMDGPVLTEATVFSSTPDQITFVIQLCLRTWSLVEGHSLHPPSPGGSHGHGYSVRMWY